ncbi:unnamed protein product [Musa textilis]
MSPDSKREAGAKLILLCYCRRQRHRGKTPGILPSFLAAKQ